MTPRAIFILLLAAFATALALWLNVKVWLGPEKADVYFLGEAADWKQQTNSFPATIHVISHNQSGGITAANVIDAEAQRVINELVDAGMTPEKATLFWSNRIVEAGSFRANRPAIPGVRTNIDEKKWPLFQEP